MRPTKLTPCTVPNGGYVATIFQKVAAAHLASRKQPHTISAHWTFPSRTEAGIARLRVVEARVGRGTSVLHIGLHQHGLLPEAPFITADSQPQVVAYITQGNLDVESGVTLPTQWTLEHAPPKADLNQLSSGNEPNWERTRAFLMTRKSAINHLELYSRRRGHVLPTTHDFWICFANGDRFNQDSLGFIVDASPPLLTESFRPSSPNVPAPTGGFAFDQAFWYPTLTMTLDVKRKLPEDGVKWLRLRSTAKQIRNGRYDAEVMVFDEEGNLVALSNHCCMIVDFNRNLATRKTPETKI